ncbi:MAG: MFS transporter [Halanaerobiales bacterium]|nr:MFS transporter [Halanaerobiales bacterium]
MITDKYIDINKNYYRWLILGLGWISYFVIAMAWYIMPTLEHKIIELYNITPVQYSTALTIPFLFAGIMSLVGGILADNLGIKKAATIGIILSGVGILLRASTSSYLNLLIPMIIVGVGMGLILPNLPKLVSIWFPPDETGLATGIYNTGLMAGLATGLVIAPYIPNWFSGNIVLGILIILSGILFFCFVKNSPPGKKIPDTTVFEGISTAIKSKNSWLVSISLFLSLAGMISLQGALPGGLNKIYNIPMSIGGRVASLISYFGILGSITLPFIANKFNNRKIFVILIPIIFSTIMYITWLLGSNMYILWIGTIIAGYVAGGALPLLMEVPTFLPRIKDDPVQQQHVGGAAGMLTMLMNIGGFVGLSFIVMPLIIRYGYSFGFFVAALLFASQALFNSRINFP